MNTVLDKLCVIGLVLSVLTFKAYAAPRVSSTGQPAELGQTVNGFQDDFTAATRDPNWVAVGPGGDYYVQTNGVLQVATWHLDPNHLIYTAPGASNTIQEVLARLRVVGFGTNNDQSRGGIAVGVITNVPAHTPATDWIGVNINVRDNSTDATGPNRHFRMLDDLRAWGPQLNLVWTNNVWYWMRLRMEPKMDNTNDYFGKVWQADGSTPEPADWQMKWPNAGTGAAPAPHGGYPGITGCSGSSTTDGLGQLEVDYILIKSTNLPNVTVNFAPLGPPVNAPEMRSVARGTNNLVMNWFGGNLQSSGTVTGLWTSAGNLPSPTTVKTVGGTNKFYRVEAIVPTNVLAFDVYLSGPAEVPPTTSTGTGSGTILIEGDTLTYHISFSGLTGPAVAAHIHGPATASEAVGVIVPLNFPAGDSGVMSGTIDLTKLTADQVNAIKTGDAYVNIHTAANSGGEIRGQLLPR